MLLIAVLALLLLAAVLNHASKRRMRESVANIKGPYCFPVFGAIYLLYRMSPKNLLQRSHQDLRKYGNIMHGWFLNRLVVMTADLELNEQLLSSQVHIVKHRNYRMLTPWLGEGLLLSDGKKWHARRKIITPTFHFKILEQFVEVFDQQSSIFVRRLTQRADGCSAFDIYPFVCAAALDIIAETAMGTKIYAQTEKGTDYAVAVNAMTKLMCWRFIHIYSNNEIIFAILCPHLKRRQTRMIRTMHNFTRNVIEQRRESLQATFTKPASEGEVDEVDDVGSKKRLALLDVLLQSTIDGKPLSNEDIREEVDTFMFEGHDTTTSAICFALHLIARHPEVQAKLLAEAQDVLGQDQNEAITLRHLNELKYMECVIKEALRLYPSVPIIGRQLVEDFSYTHPKLGDGILPAGTEVLIALYALLRDANIFDNPNDFIPERHEDSKQTGAFSLIPFSAGPRNCIGQKFAMLEMKVLLSKTVRAYELLPLGEAVSPELNIVMRSSNGYQLGLKKRML